MRKINFIPFLLSTMIFFCSCRNETVHLLAKKWDCIKVDNLTRETTGFQSPQDSVNTIQLQTILESLSWTFKETLEYECSVSGNVLIKGTYEIQDHEKTLVCTPETKNSVNRYTISLLTENDLVLNTNASGASLILHFKPH